ncbi:MAG: T9SS type A sorting domain-containing protein [Saprospiraceae bacterium]|nr:T9SS type A sorting domain-containing protein [Saprospiraceae bacterium]
MKNLLPVMLWMGPVFGVDLGAQTCATLSLPPVANVCQSSTVQSYVINNFDAANTYTFNLISGSAVINYVAPQPFVNIIWNTPGDVVFEMVELDLSIPIGPCDRDTFRINVGATNAPQINCNDTVNVSLDETCNGLVTPAMILEGTGFDFRDYDVVIRDINTDAPIASSPYVNSSHLGRYYKVSVTHRCSGNYCWGLIKVEDKLKPRITCRSIEVDCGESILPSNPNVGFPKPVGAPNPTPVPGQPRTYTSSSSFYDNCGPTRFTYNDRTVQVVCPPPAPYIDTIFRTWHAVDNYGNDTTCVDTILMRAGSLSNITCPPNYDGLPGGLPALTCTDSITPTFTGFPGGVNCRNINYSYNDIRLGACAGSFKILREWFIVDWCTGEDTTCIQVIKVVDDQAPLVGCPAPNYDTIYTLPHACYGNFETGLPVILRNECSYPLVYELLVKRGVLDTSIAPSSLEATTEGVFRRMNGATLLGFRVENLPVGLSWLVYRVTDACGNVGECIKEVVVVETSRPTAVCHFETIVTLTDDGWAKIDAIAFDDGSHDNCEMGGFKVMRMDSSICGGKGNTSFDDYIEFCCDDVSLTVPVIVRLLVIDRAGNTNECMVRVFVHDKKPPVVTCLPNITVSCQFDYSDLTKFGVYRTKEEDRKNIILNDPNNNTVAQPHFWGRDGLISEDCTLFIDTSEVTFPQQCGLATIQRTFVFRDKANNSVSCTQFITVRNFSPFNLANVVFPADTSLSGCLDHVDTSATGSPKWPAGSSCSSVIATYEDEVFNQVENVCFKILRKWTVIDWCSFNPTTRAGSISRTQVIKVINKDKPDFTSSCDNRSFDVISADCNGNITLTASAIDICGNSTGLVWSYKIDIGNNGSVDINGNSNDASGVYPVGSHRITWTVEDRCGNFETCSYIFTLIDRKQPTPVCRSGIITVIMPTSGSVTIWANDLNIASNDNCTPANQLLYSFSSNTNNNSRTFTCAQIPDGVSEEFSFRIYVTDLAGNQDYCETKVIIQDGLGNACPDNLGGGGTTATAIVAGLISTDQNSTLEEAMVAINGATPSLPKYHITQKDGKYVFAALPVKENYTLSAVKDDDVLNGVTTADIVAIQKHILGIQSLESPYKYIAADVNNSRSITARDITDLRKLILGVTEKFPIGKSWVFVNADQKFNDPTSPWPYEDAMVLNQLDNHQMDKNFIAVKLGDINNSALTNQLSKLSSRNQNVATLEISDVDFEMENIINIPIFMNGIETISGLQAELRFDPSVLEFVDLRAGSMKADNGHINPFLLENGVIRFSIDQVSGVGTDRPLFELVFNTKKNGQVKENIYMSRSSFVGEAYSSNGETYTLNLGFRSHEEDQNTEKGFVLYQNRPNPFSTVTDISFYLPKEGEANLKICDVNGRILKQLTRKFSAGMHTVQISNKDIEQSGILYYILESSEHRAVKKMILIK